MLNELCEIRKSLDAGGVACASRHPDVKPPGKKLTLKIRLNGSSEVDAVEVVPKELVASWWTLRDGQQNSFPNVAFRTEKNATKNHLPLLHFADEHTGFVKIASNKRGSATERCEALLSLIDNVPINADALGDWPGYRERIQERLSQLESLRDTDAAPVHAVMDRFIVASSDPRSLVTAVVSLLRDGLRQQPNGDLMNIASDVLIEGNASFYFDVSEFDDYERNASDPENINDISHVLLAEPSENTVKGVCCLAGGDPTVLVDDKFPQPNLPLLGQTYIFAKNADTPCSYRYRRSGTDAISIGSTTSVALQGAFDAITAESRENKTWAAIPSEIPKQSDLLLAYVAADIDYAVTEPLTIDREREANFEEKAKRLSQAFQAKQLDRKKDPRLRLVVIRKVDTANRKVIYSDEQSVDRLLAACDDWVEACRGVPPVTIPVPVKKGEPALPMSPYVIPPASLVAMTKEQFIRNGEGRTDVVGGRYSEALDLFWGSDYVKQRAAGIWLRLLLGRRRLLLIGIAQALRVSFDELKKFDSRGALTTITALHVVLNALNPKGHDYMNDAGFKLGQLLAAADELHCGYCHDVRKSSIPSRMMGNAIVPMAEKNPQRALTVLCRRWPVYEAWAKKKGSVSVAEKYKSTEGKKLSGKDRKEAQKQWAIARGVAACHRAKPIAESLKDKLGNSSNDEFRAELILGYITGSSATTQGTSIPNPTEGENDE